MGHYAEEDEPHVADGLLELYALNRLSVDQLATVEEHLLLCAWYQDRLEETEAYVRTMRGAQRRRRR